MDNIKNDKYYIGQILDDINKIIKYTNNVSYSLIAISIQFGTVF